MKILGIDASGKTASVALLEDEVIRAEYTLNIGLTHSQTLLPMVDAVLDSCGCSVSQLDAIAVSAGPGSFTGLRIGAATAKGLALPRSLPLVPVSTLELLAANVQAPGWEVRPLMDARRAQVYTAGYTDGRLSSPEEAISLEALTERLSRAERPQYFVGDALPLYRGQLSAALGERCAFGGAAHRLQRAACLAELAAARLAAGEAASGEALALHYIRKPQAEREREERGLNVYDITH